ncbi:hypothetical protein [Nitratifractor sp.]
MKKTTLLKQALKLRDNPPFGEVKGLMAMAREYQAETNDYFVRGGRGERVRLLDEAAFFRFLSETVQMPVDSFTAIERALGAESRAENIAATGDSKSSAVAPFAKTLLLRRAGESPVLYRDEELGRLDDIRRVVAVENAESFLDFETLDRHFQPQAFVYLGGQPNALTRTFLSSREVLFFIDWDIVSLNFYDDFACKSKSLFIPENFDRLLERYGNEALFLKQRYALRESYSPETGPIIEKLEAYAKVLEQEIWHDPSAAH